LEPHEFMPALSAPAPKKKQNGFGYSSDQIIRLRALRLPSPDLKFVVWVKCTVFLLHFLREQSSLSRKTKSRSFS